MRLDQKYGCSTNEAWALLNKAKELKLNIVGVRYISLPIKLDSIAAKIEKVNESYGNWNCKRCQL